MRKKFNRRAHFSNLDSSLIAIGSRVTKSAALKTLRGNYAPVNSFIKNATRSQRSAPGSSSVFESNYPKYPRAGREGVAFLPVSRFPSTVEGGGAERRARVASRHHRCTVEGSEPGAQQGAAPSPLLRSARDFRSSPDETRLASQRSARLNLSRTVHAPSNLSAAVQRLCPTTTSSLTVSRSCELGLQTRLARVVRREV